MSNDREILKILNLHTPPYGTEPPLEDLSLSISRSEILGIGGVVGNGQRSLALALAGSLKPVSGTITFDGSDISGKSIAERLQAGIRRLPENLAEEALLSGRPLWENLLLGRQRERSFGAGGILRRGNIMRFAMEQVREHKIAASGAREPLSSLSGGNRQKVALARTFAGPVRLAILEQPSRGLDLHAAGRLHERIFELAGKAGVTFVVISYDLDELMSLCDRIAVFYRGKIAGTADRKDFSRDLLGGWMTGAC